MESYLRAISNLDLSEYVTYNAQEADLATYGLDDPELTVTVQYTPEAEDGEEAESQTFALSLSRDPEERKAAEAAAEEADAEEADAEETDAQKGEEEEEITAYARVGESKIIYKISSTSYETLMAAGYDDLRHLKVFTASFDDVTALDISLEGASYTITAQGEGEEKVFSLDGEEIEIDGLQTALEQMSASSFTDEAPSQKEEISLTISLDNEGHPQVQIQLYRYDGEQCLALIDGEPVSLVPRANVVDLMEAVNALVL